MAAMTITTGLDSLATHFCKMQHVFFISTANQALTAITAVDMELPILESGVNFDTGTPSVNRVKITEGRTICTNADQGEPGISFQVASVDGPVNDLLMTEKVASAEVGGTIDGVTYEGKGYSLAPKKVTGALFMTSKDKKSAIYLPNVEMFAHFVGNGGNDSTGYYNIEVTPLEDTNGAAFYPLKAKA